MAMPGPEDGGSPPGENQMPPGEQESTVTKFVKPDEPKKIAFGEPPVVICQGGFTKNEVEAFHPNQEEDDVKVCSDIDWSDNHLKVLTLMYFYAKASLHLDEAEEWIREIPLQVLVFEGVVAGLLDFDYAPVSMLIPVTRSSKRVWFNVSQEAKTAVDDLRQGGLFNSLKVVTEDERAQTMFQVSKEGLTILETMSQEIFDEVGNFVFNKLPGDCWTRLRPNQTPPMTSNTVDAKIQCRFEWSPADPDFEDPPEGAFHFFISHGDPRTNVITVRKSNVTKTEDVSYVTSPYMPVCLLTEKFGKTEHNFHSNKHRVPDLLQSGSGEIADALDEIIALSNCVACVCEYMPFGANQLQALNTRLGVLERLKNTFLSKELDHNPMDTILRCEPRLVSTDVVDCDFSNFVNFCTQINLPEEGDIVQVEEFGMHINVDGTVVYGQKIDGMFNHGTVYDEENISLDVLSRLLVDIHEDSSEIMDSLLSPVQRSQLDFVFAGEPYNRGKYNLIFANKIHPAHGQDPTFDYLDVKNYMNRSDNENEVKQILSDVTGAHLIAGTDVLIIGRVGLILAGPNVIGNSMAEALFVDFMKLQIIGMFIDQFSMRHVNVELNLGEANNFVNHATENPLFIDKFRDLLSNSTRECILLSELVQYLEVSLLLVERSVKRKDGTYSKDKGQAERLCAEIWDVLGLNKQLRSHRLRLRDMTKKCDSSMKTVTVLNMKGNTANVARLTETATKIEMNFKKLVDGLDAQIRSAGATELMSNIFSSNLAFILLDRLDGDAFLGFEGTGIGNISPLTGELPAQWVVDYIQIPLIDNTPGLFFVLNILFLVFFIYILDRGKKAGAEGQKGAESHTITFNKKIFLDKLEVLVEGQNIIQTDVGAEKIIMWYDSRSEWWCGCEPKITMRYNTRNSFLTKVAIAWQNTKTDLDEHEIANAFRFMLEENGVFDTGFLVKKIDKQSGRELSHDQDNSFLDRWYEHADVSNKSKGFTGGMKRLTKLARPDSSEKAQRDTSQTPTNRPTTLIEAPTPGRRGSREFATRTGMMSVQERVYMKRTTHLAKVKEAEEKKDSKMTSNLKRGASSVRRTASSGALLLPKRSIRQSDS